MLELLEQYSVTQIIMFIIILAVAIKQVIEFIDWAQERIAKRDKQHQDKQLEEQTTDARLDKLEESLTQAISSIENIGSKVDILMDSDKDAIKAFITKEHHEFCYQKGYIDDYSLDCIEKRYKHYQDEKGNSFISQLMLELRNLPREESNK